MSAPSASIRDLDRVEDRVRLHRQARDSAVLIVEGRADETLLSQVFTHTEIFRAGTRSSVVRAAAAIDEWSLLRVLCIADRDFEESPAATDLPECLVFYDNADLEAMLIDLGALRVLLLEYADEAKLTKWGGPEAVSRHLMAEARRVAQLRRANSRDALGLDFKNVDLGSKCDPISLTVDIAKYGAALRNANLRNGRECTLSEKEIASFADKALTPFFRGKDLLALLAVAFRRALGSRPLSVSEVSLLEGALRQSGVLLLVRSEWTARISRRLM